MNLDNLCEIAKTAALKAGEIIAAKQGETIETQSKIGGENIASQVVTEVDIAAENAILEILPVTEQIGLLAEESASEDTSRFEKEYFWCIDPLDGTLCYSKNEDGYSTSIALVAKNGEPVIGVVYNPRSNTLYSAIKGQGALRNGELLKVKYNSNDLTLLYDQSYTKHPEFKNQLEKLKSDLIELGLSNLNIHHLGGAVMNGISVVDMSPAIYFKFPKKSDGGGSLWDFAASSIIAKEAGSWSSDYFKEPLDLNRKDSTFMNHKGVIYSSDEKLLEIIP